MAWQGMVLVIVLGVVLVVGAAAVWAALLVRGSARESARHVQRIGHEESVEERG